MKTACHQDQWGAPYCWEFAEEACFAENPVGQEVAGHQNLQDQGKGALGLALV